MGSLLAGGLGFGLGAALGAKLAAPGREVISIVGDGSYMFGNPLPFHYVGRAENLATLTIIANNQSWHAVRASTLDVFPGGYAAKANIMPLTELKPSPDYEKVITTCGGVGEKVVEPGDLPAALKRALRGGALRHAGAAQRHHAGARFVMSPIDIKVLSTTAMKTVFEELAPAFERATGNRLNVTLGPSLRLEKQLGEGEAADMAIVSVSGARDLVASGRMVAGSIVDIATSSIGVAVQKGAPRPDISIGRRFQARHAWRQNRSPAQNRSAAARAAFTSQKFSLSSASPKRCRQKRNTAPAAPRGSPAWSCCAARPTSAFSRWPS